MYHYIYKHCFVSFVVLTLPTISIICGYVLCKVILSYYKHIILLLKLLLDSPKMVMHGKKRNTLYYCKSDAVEASSDINDNSISVLYPLSQRKLFFSFSLLLHQIKGKQKEKGNQKIFSNQMRMLLITIVQNGTERANSLSFSNFLNT